MHINWVMRRKQVGRPILHGLSLEQLYTHVMPCRLYAIRIIRLIIVVMKYFSVPFSTLDTYCHDGGRIRLILPRTHALRATHRSCMHASRGSSAFVNLQFTVLESMFDKRVSPLLCIPFTQSCPCNIACRLARIRLSCQVRISTWEQDRMSSLVAKHTLHLTYVS